MSVTVYSEIVYPTYVKRRYEVTLTDNLGANHVYVLGMYKHQPINDGSEVEAMKLQSVKDQEIQSWINQMEVGLDPWHTSPFINSVPLWNNWNDASSLSLKNFLISDDRQELLNCNLSATNTSNNDLDNVLTSAGSTFTQTNLRSEIQQAVNTQTELDTYTPSVSE